MNWNPVIGLGVAGNFTGHLEQAGEAADFVHVQSADAGAPKGIFPFYVPVPESQRADHFLHCMPISANVIRLNSPHENHQVEPEMALLCDLSYSGTVLRAIIPRRAMAHNDCSIRREGARKISEKKNWGAESKGTSARGIEIDQFKAGGVLDRYRLTCFLLRDQQLHSYGVDSPVNGYSYFYEQLIDWLIERVNNQKDEGPLEDLAAWLRIAGYPQQALISVGATRYTDFGASTYLEPGDHSLVVLYDGDLHDEAAVKRLLSSGSGGNESGLCILDQVVRS